MEVLFYQVIIFVAIFISSLKSRKVLNLITLIIALFTITHIFMPWLMVVQFITITVAYMIGRRISIKEARPEYVTAVQSGKKVDDSPGFFG